MTTSFSRAARLWCSAILCALLLWAWAAPLGAMEPPGADAQALWSYLNQEPNFRKWGTWQEFQKMRRSHSPFGHYVRIYINDVALQGQGHRPAAGVHPGARGLWHEHQHLRPQ